MKTVVGILLVVLLCVMAGGCRKGQDGAASGSTKTATEFINLLVKGDYAAASEKCDPEKRKTMLSADQLRNTWQQFEKAQGGFQKQQGTRSSEITLGDQKGQQVIIICRFTKMTVDVVTVLDAKQQVIDLTFARHFED